MFQVPANSASLQSTATLDSTDATHHHVVTSVPENQTKYCLDINTGGPATQFSASIVDNVEISAKIKNMFESAQSHLPSFAGFCMLHVLQTLNMPVNEKLL